MNNKINLLGSTAVIIYLSLFKLLIHIVVNFFDKYGIFRDEFYYLACADFLDFGYVDHPPLSIFILYFSRLVFGDSLFAIRLLPAFAGAIIVFTCGKITQLLGGKLYAQVLTCLAIIVAPGYLGLHGFYSMNVFDHLFWILMIYCVISVIKTNNSKMWLWFGFVAGLGLQNKISVLFLGFGLIAGLLLTKHRKYLINKYFLIGGLIAIILFIPHIFWQIRHGWSTLEFMSNATLHKIANISPISFFMEQILNMNPATFLVWFSGLFFLLFSKKLKDYKIFAFAFIAIFVLFIFQRSKPYYLFPIYPILFVSGSIFLEELFSKKYTKWLRPAVPFFFIVSGMFSAPFALPILSVDKFITFSSATGMTPSSGENNQLGLLPQHFADRFGWEELVSAVATVYHSLPDSEKSKAAIFVNNYGEAGAIDYYRKKYDLPRALCGHNNYYLWGPHEFNGEIVIRLGGGTADHHLQYFDSVLSAGFYNNKYVMPYENYQTIYICKGLKNHLKDVWTCTKAFI